MCSFLNLYLVKFFNISAKSFFLYNEIINGAIVVLVLIRVFFIFICFC